MKYSVQKMEQLMKISPKLESRMKKIMKEHDLEREYALKALYHAEIKDGGRHQRDYQEL
ncbi:hypothetical protein [Sporosarcina pasteurii]|uniref:Uncharacterized protein n=1 Tax=Sporosarcina pasteurii TaxID=1474 RepID=A0A380CKE6_SPOPA|nr:hypothetical protein [Sporosarcina pasteurii]MDS9472097.1 hypothetical protein [Sporosarcina pasteurii]SUJ20804.1 Uncharacterised protein [Sporosarcina pasteurii]